MLVSRRVDSLEKNQQIFPTDVVNPCGSWVEQADSLDWSDLVDFVSLSFFTPPKRIFPEYPWLENVVDPCNPESICSQSHFSPTSNEIFGVSCVRDPNPVGCSREFGGWV